MGLHEVITSGQASAVTGVVRRCAEGLERIRRVIRAVTRQGDGICAFLIVQVALLGAFYWPVLSGAAEFYHRDLPLYFEPLNRYLGDTLRDGRFPLWNDRLYTGMPQVAVGHPNVFYPFTWIVALLPFSRGLGLYLVLHQMMLGTGMFLLVRLFGWGPVACWIAGVAGAWNGYTTGLQSNYQLITAATWIPILLWLLGGKEHFEVSKRHLVGTVVCVYLLIGSGAPELIGPGIALAVVWVALMTYDRYTAGLAWVGALLWRAGAISCGALLAAPMILPAIEWLRLSPRGSGLLPVNVLAWSTEWYQWLGMLVSRPFGVDAVLGVPRYVDSPFVGPVVFVMAALGVWRTKKHHLALWLGIFALSCLITAGATTGLGAWMVDHIPGFSIVRYPVKLILLPLGLLVFAAARGSMVVGAARMTGTAMLLASLSLMAVGFGAILSSKHPDQHWFWTTVAPTPWPIPIEWRRTANTMLAQNLFGAAIWLLILVVALFARRRLWVSRTLLQTIVLTTITVPLVTSAWRYERNWLPLPVYSPEPTWERIRAEVGGVGGERRWRVFPLDYTTDAMTVSVQWLQQRYGDGGKLKRHDRFWVGHAASSRTLLLTNTAIDANVASATGYEATPTKTYTSLTATAAVRASIAPERVRKAGLAPSDRALARICAITAAKLVVVKPDPRATSARYFAPGPYFQALFDLPAFSADAPEAPRVYEVKGVRPRVYATRSVSLLPDEKAVGQMLTTDKETLFDREQHHVYLVEGNGTAAAAVLDANSVGKTGDADRITLIEDRGERVLVRVVIPRSGLLVLADQYYPGWVATVDGTETEVLPVNLINRGVLVPAGEHDVEFVYRPRSVRWGLIVCIAAMAGLGLGLRLWKPAGENLHV